jgi:hypothetical protein
MQAFDADAWVVGSFFCGRTAATLECPPVPPGRLSHNPIAWEQGFAAGERGVRITRCPYPLSETDRWSWTRGWIEGDAKRQGCEYSKGKGRMVDVTDEGLAFQFLGVSPSKAEPTGWEWTCRWCGHRNRGTDSSLHCEQCGTPR